MNILGWILTVVCGLLVAAFLVYCTIQDWIAMVFAISTILVVMGLCYGLQLVGVIR